MEEEEDALRRVLLLGVGLDRGRGEGTGDWKSGRVGEWGREKGGRRRERRERRERKEYDGKGTMSRVRSA